MMDLFTIEQLGIDAVALMTVVLLCILIVPCSSPPPKELYMSPAFRKPTTRDTTVANMAEAMVKHIRARGECRKADLAGAGFTEAQILAYHDEAHALAVATGRAPARDPAQAVA